MAPKNKFGEWVNGSLEATGDALGRTGEVIGKAATGTGEAIGNGWEAVTKSSKRSSTKRRSKRKERADPYEGPSHPGLNIGKTPSLGLYKAARVTVLEREAELVELHALRGTGKAPQGDKRYHYLHGKAYNLADFVELHPGGSGILKMAASMPDATPLFESYHAFADRDGILKKLQKYRVADEDLEKAVPVGMYSFDDDGFYRTVTRRVRQHFSGDAEVEDKFTKSVSVHVKADRWQLAKVLVQVALNVGFYAAAFILRLPTPVAMVCALLAGFFQIQWGFTAMHDASHFAMGKRNHWLNLAVLRTWNGWSLWSSQVWQQHHVVRHHAYTGNNELDPDIHHALPIFRKHPDDPIEKQSDIAIKLGNAFGNVGWYIGAITMYVFLPGMWFGQVIQYMLYRTAFRKHMWMLPSMAKTKGFEMPWWETAIYATNVILNLQRMNPLVTFAYAVALNFTYSMCILADHDLVESAITNHIETDAFNGAEGKAKPDWGECQVRNATNFVNDKYNLFAFAFGSINYQVEHHLFPGMSHTKLPIISPIVRETCEEFGIPYTMYPSIVDAWKSFALVARAVMTDKETTLEEVEALRAFK